VDVVTTLPGLTGGYSCANCGQWVPSGTFHTCSVPPKIPVPVNNYHSAPDPNTERIADALERLAKAAERALQLLERKWRRH
jgi:hypothetical protein